MTYMKQGPTRKGGLISESFTLWLTSLKKLLNYDPEHYPTREKMLRVVIWHLLFGDVSQSEKLFEIKLPLSKLGITISDIFEKTLSNTQILGA